MKRIPLTPLAATLVLLALVGPGPATAMHAMPCPDLNGDRAVNITDLTIEASYLGQAVPPAPAQADMDGDLDVDNGDAAYFYPPLLPPPEWIVTCQDTPIGRAGAVGGLTQLAGAAAPDEHTANVRWLAVSAIAGLAGLVATRLLLTGRRP